LSFDRYHENAQRIFRIARKLPEGHTHGGKTEAASMIPAVGPALVEDYPEVVSQVRLVRRRDLLLKQGRNGYLEPEVFFVEPDIFKVFTLPLVQGNWRDALSDPDSIILSQSAVVKYFGEENPLGKTIRFDQSRDLKVTGILRDMPQNSHFIMDVIIPFETLIASTQWDLTSWSSNFCSTYILLGEGVDPKELGKKLPALYQKHAETEAKPGGYLYCQPFLQALVDIHLHSDLDGEFSPNNSVSNIYIFSSIAFLILLLACINYTSLATARFTLRGKEVGIRKTAGAQRSQLITQFLGESLLITVIACLLSMAFVQLFLPVFNDLVDALGWEAPLGREFTYWRGETGRVTGVVKDFNLHSLHKNIEPMYLYYHRNPWSTNYLSVKIRGGNIPETLAFLRSRMKIFSPEYPLDYSFFDDIFDQSYRSEQRLSKMFHIFGLLAVGIACLGLFGLAAFSTEQRSKEVGIRKVLGASTGSIFILLSKSFFKWVFLSNLIAWPIGYLAMRTWLLNFAYRTPMSLWIFFLTAAAALVVALFTVMFQTMKASMTDPIESLGFE